MSEPRLSTNSLPGSPKISGLPKLPNKLGAPPSPLRKRSSAGSTLTPNDAFTNSKDSVSGCPVFSHTTTNSPDRASSFASSPLSRSSEVRTSTTSQIHSGATRSVFHKLRNDCSIMETNLDLANKDVLKRDDMAFILRENDLEMSALLTAQQVEYDVKKQLLDKRLNARSDRKKAKQQQRNTVRGTKRRDTILEIQEVNATALEKLKVALFQRRKAFERATAHLNFMHTKQRNNLADSQDRQMLYEKNLMELETKHFREEIRLTLQKKFQSRVNHKIALNKRINDQLREYQQVEMRHSKEKFEAELAGFEEMDNLKIKHMSQVNEAKAKHMIQAHDEKEAALASHEAEKHQKLKKQHAQELKKLQREHKMTLRQMRIQHEQRIAALNLGGGRGASRGGSNIGSAMGSAMGSAVGSALGSALGSKRHSASTSRDSLTSEAASNMAVSVIAEEGPTQSPNAAFSPLQLKSELMAEEFNDRDDNEFEDELSDTHIGLQNLLRRQREELNNLEATQKAEINNCMLALSAKMADMEERHNNELNMLDETQAQDLSALKTFQEKELAMEESLHDSEMKMLVERRVLNSVLGTILDGIININPVGTILRFNPAAERMFGYQSHEVVGKNVKMLMPAQFSLNHDQFLRNYLATGIKKVIGTGRRVRGLRKNGEEFPLELSISEVKEDGEHIFTGIARDLTEEVKIEEENKRRDAEKQTQLQNMLVQLDKAKTKSADLLKQMLPESVSTALLEGRIVEPQQFTSATIFFLDICRFTSLCHKIQPFDTIELLNTLYNLFDEVISQYDAYKVETIGDSYMVVSGVPVANETKHAGEIATMALHMLHKVYTFVSPIDLGGSTIQVRIGINSGPVVAGVVGSKMPRYCLFGDTVNTASRMESTGQPLRIQLSQSTYDCLKAIGDFKMTERGEIDIKGKGKMKTYWLTGKEEFPYDLPPQ